MSVLIKDIKMPECCGQCQIRFGIDCDLWKHVRCVGLDRHKNCPVIEVTPHGRLGDLDAPEETIEALIEKHLHGYTKSTWDFVCELRSIISNAPTIIPAEEGET